MADQQVVTIRGSNLGSSILEKAVIDGFKALLRGPLFRNGEAGYDDARKIWNGMIDRRPALIACCRGVADIMNSVNFARTHEILVAVRGGGHNVAGNAVCDGGLMIDLSGMKSVRVDPVQWTARADAGVTWGEFDRETQAFGLA
jgi:FAD/FMN-containing dehydrogenase